MGGTCKTHEGEMCIQIFWRGSQKNRDQFEDLSIFEIIILKWKLKKSAGR
jgi:hypothetical protein